MKNFYKLLALGGLGGTSGGAGGGAQLPFGGGVSKFSSGTFTYPFNGGINLMQNITVEHNLGYVPTGGMFIALHRPPTGATRKIMFMCYQQFEVGCLAVNSKAGSLDIGGNHHSGTYAKNLSGEGSGNFNYGIYGANETTATLGVIGDYSLGASHSYQFAPDTTYAWILW